MDALMQGQPMAITCVDQLRDQNICKYLSKEGIKSVVSLPILHEEHVAGLLRLLTKDLRVFYEQEINFTLSLAEQVGVALANGRMFQEMENQVQFLSELRDISRLVNSTLDLDEILTAIVEKLLSILKVKGCTIRLLHPATNRLELVAASGLSKTYLERGSISREDSIFRVLKGQPVAIYDAVNDSMVDYHEDNYSTASHLFNDKKRGLFSTRAPRRPTPLSFSIVQLLKREANTLVIKGIDVLNGTPLIDIKPYVLGFDAKKVTIC